MALVFGEIDAAAADRVNRHIAGCPQCAGELAWLRAERLILRERERAQPPLPDSLWASIEARLDGGAQIGRERPRRPRPSPASWVRARLRTRWVPLGLATGLAAAALLLLWMATGGTGVEGRGDERSRSAERPAGAQPVAEAAGAGQPNAADGGDAARPANAANGLAEAERAVAEAERAHLAAIDALERAYGERRARLDPETAREHDQELRRTRESYARERLAAGDLESRLLLLDAYSEYRHLLQLLVQDLEARN